MTIDDLLAAYNTAFVSYDLDAAVACYAPTCVFVSEGASGAPIVLASDPVAIRPRVSQILDWNWRLGVARLDSAARWSLALSPRQALRHLRITARDRDGEPLYRFDGVYAFVLGEGWRIGAICHNQVPALLARLHPEREDALERP